MAQTDAAPEEAAASATTTPTPEPSPAKAPWAGRFGLGFSQITVNPVYPTYYQADVVNLLSVRYGLSDAVILEVLAGASVGNQFDYNSSYSVVYDPYWAYCFGLGDKINLAEPAEGFWIQEVNRYLYLENSAQSTSPDGVDKEHYQYLSLSAGIGFEYFLPFLKNLSLETVESVEFDTNWETFISTPTSGSPASVQNISTWSLQVVSPGFNLTSLSIHYYF